MPPENTPPRVFPLAKGAWTTVALLWVAGCLNYLDRTMITTMHGSLVKAFAMTEAQFGLLTTGFLIVYAAVSPLGGFLADRFGRRRIILLSIFGWSLATWLTAYATTYSTLLLLRALLGLSEACYLPAAMGLITDYHRGSTRSFATGLQMTGLVMGSTIGGLGGWLAEHHDWSFAYKVIGLPNVAYSVLLFFLLRDGPDKETGAAVTSASPAQVSFGDAMISLCTNRSFLLVLCAWCLQGAVGWVIIGWMPTQMHEQFKLSQGAAGFSALGYVYVMQLIGLLLGGLWSDRWSLTYERSRLIIPVIGLVMAAPAFWLAGHSPQLSFTIFSLMVWGFAAGFMGANMMPIICMVARNEYRASALGVMNCVTAICGGLSIYAVGMLRDARIDLTQMLAFAAVGILLCALFLFLVKAAPAPAQ
ncbi:MAG: MFS transporter [Opitutus sp.]|nr:MFS transporter [Opitutus sp.]